MTWRRALPLLLLAAVALAVPLLALAQQPPLFETTKITDNVYLFRYGGHHVRGDARRRDRHRPSPRPWRRRRNRGDPEDHPGAHQVRVYSHHHYDHIEGGKPFKDAGATFIAHMNAKTRLEALKYPDVVIPDIGTGTLHAIELGGTRLELHYVGRHHSDNSLVMLLPKEKLLFTVDFIPIESLQFRGLAGQLPSRPRSTRSIECSALDWDRMTTRPSLRGRAAGD